MIMMLKCGTGHNFFITANSLLRQIKLGTNLFVLKRVDCITIVYLSSGSEKFSRIYDHYTKKLI